MVRHPLIDDVVGAALVVESHAPVVRLTDALSALLLRANAAGRVVVLLTGPDAALTPALRHAIGAAGAGWAVRDADGSLRDGRTGSAVQSVEDFAVRGPGLPDVPAPAHPVSTTAVEQVGVDLTLRHRLERAVDVGSAIEALCAAAGCTPTRWGTAEPLSVPWDRWVVTQYAKHSAPGVSTSFAIGDGVSATMTAHMDDGMVIETVSAVLTLPDDGVERVLDAVREIAASVVPVFGVVMQRHGDPDHLVRAVSYGEPTPAAVVVGPEATLLLDRGAPWPPPLTAIESFGAAGEDEDGMLVRFEDGWDALESFLDRVDEERFVSLVGGGPLSGPTEDGELDDHVARSDREREPDRERDPDDVRATGGPGAA